MRLIALTLAAAAILAAQPVKKQAEVFGQKLNYIEAGPEGPPVILLHGLGGDVTNWSFAIPAISAKNHVIAIDQIGFGASDKPAIAYRVGTLVDFLGGFMKKTGIAKATLVGNSLGGWTAAAFALAHPEMVDKLVLVDAAGLSNARLNLPPLTREALSGLRPSTLAGVKRILATIFTNPMFQTDAAAEQYFTNLMRKSDGPTIAAFVESVLRGEDYLDGQTAKIKAPTLVIWGRQDGLVPLAFGEAYAADIPGAKLKVIDKCGHVPQVECAAAFSKELLAFLEP